MSKYIVYKWRDPWNRNPLVYAVAGSGYAIGLGFEQLSVGIDAETPEEALQKWWHDRRNSRGVPMQHPSITVEALDTTGLYKIIETEAG